MSDSSNLGARYGSAPKVVIPNDGSEQSRLAGSYVDFWTRSMMAGTPERRAYNRESSRFLEDLDRYGTYKTQPTWEGGRRSGTKLVWRGNRGAWAGKHMTIAYSKDPKATIDSFRSPTGVGVSDDVERNVFADRFYDNYYAAYGRAPEGFPTIEERRAYDRVERDAWQKQQDADRGPKPGRAESGGVK